MEHVDSRNELNKVVQTLQAMIETLREVAEKVDKDIVWLRSIVDVMYQVCVMLSKKSEGLLDIQKQIRNQVAEMYQKSVPLSLPNDVKVKLMATYQDCLNETNLKMKEINAKYLQSIRKHNRKLLTDLSNNKGLWPSKKVFWWAAGIAYALSLVGFATIV